MSLTASIAPAEPVTVHCRLFRFKIVGGHIMRVVGLHRTRTATSCDKAKLSPENCYITHDDTLNVHTHGITALHQAIKKRHQRDYVQKRSLTWLCESVAKA